MCKRVHTQPTTGKYGKKKSSYNKWVIIATDILINSNSNAGCKLVNIYPRANEVRVKILTAGVSFADILMREGIHPESVFKRRPFSPGWDIVGTVDKVGEKLSTTSTWQIGDIVAALPIVGGYAQYLCVPSNQLVSVPSGVDSVEAVGIVLNYTTAYQMLHRCAHIKSGESILVHSAAGGVGTALLQLGNLVGLEMFGTLSRRKKK